MRQLSRQTILRVTKQIVQRLESLHKTGYLHNDLKLDNILVGHSDPQNIYLIDFGSATKFRDDEGRHVSKKFTGKFYGNVMFSSPSKIKLLQ